MAFPTFMWSNCAISQPHALFLGLKHPFSSLAEVPGASQGHPNASFSEKYCHSLVFFSLLHVQASTPSLTYPE